jgi:hypothetical protein
MELRIHKSKGCGWYWLQEQADSGWLLVDSFQTRAQAQTAYLAEKREPSWVKHYGHKNRVSWVFKDDWTLCIWVDQLARYKPFVVLDHQLELSRWEHFNDARIALLVARDEHETHP